MKRAWRYVGWLLVLILAQSARAQVQVGDDLRMNLSGTLDGGYSGSYGNQIPSSHGLDFGGSATLVGSYFDPNFLNFTVLPYYNQSRADSNFQSLTDSSGVQSTANLFTGSHYPGSVNFSYARNSTGTFGLIGSPNFTTVGDGYGFGIAWSALIPDKPTLSVSYSQAEGSGTIFGTNDETHSSTHTFTARSTYNLAGWQLTAFDTYLNNSSQIPYFLGGGEGNDYSTTSGNTFGVSGFHSLPWHGAAALSFTRSNYDGNFGNSFENNPESTNYTATNETASFTFHPTLKLGLYLTQNYTDNLNGFFYQNVINGGGGVPILPTSSSSNSSTLNGGATYNFTRDLYGQAQMTYYNQTYFGNSYEGSYFSGTIGYTKRIFDTFTVSATVVDSTNKFADNTLGYILNLNAFRTFGGWEASGNFTYAQNVQTLLVTYTTSYYNYGANLHRSLGRGKQWTASVVGVRSGLTNQPGSETHSESYSTSLALRRFSLTGNYTTSAGTALLTSTGIQPIPPTPGLPQEGLIVYNGTSYGAGVTLNPIPRLTISGTYTHAVSDTISNDVPSNNRTEIFYSQLQYRLRQISVLAGFTKFSQGISASGIIPGNQYSYFIGVTRSFNFF